MNGFVFHAPTEMVFGKDTETKAGELVKKYGGSKVLLHYGKGSVVKSGLLDRVKASLDRAGVPYAELGGVQPNPLLSLVLEGVELCKKEGVDFILAVGGGSAIDSAKGIAVGLANPQDDVWDYYLGKTVPKCAPVGCILTLAATGSEMSNSSVVTKDEGHIKRSIDQDIIRPRFSIMNPELTFTLPKYQIACGVADIMMHTMERYLGSGHGNELSDRIAEQVIRNTVRYGPQQLADPADYKAASEIMWSGSVSHNGMTGLGNDGGDWATHLLGHELSAKFGAAHGATLTAVWGSWARYVCKDVKALRFAQYACKVWDCEMDYGHPEKTALEGIEKTEAFFASIGMPVNLSALVGRVLTDEEIQSMADLCISLGRTSIGNTMQLFKEDVVAIYRAANT